MAVCPVTAYSAVSELSQMLIQFVLVHCQAESVLIQFVLVLTMKRSEVRAEAAERFGPLVCLGREGAEAGGRADWIFIAGLGRNVLGS